MKYVSELSGKVYADENECLAEENEIRKQQAKQKEEKEAQRKEQEKLFKVKAARLKEVKDAEANFIKLRDAYNKDYAQSINSGMTTEEFINFLFGEI